MKIILLIILFNLSLPSSAEVCSKKGIQLLGHYGKYTSPLLHSWSEASGNFTKLEIISKLKFAKAELLLENGTSVTLPLKNNHTDGFNFISHIQEQKVRPKILKINIRNKTDDIVCDETVAIIERDGMDGVLVKP